MLVDPKRHHSQITKLTLDVGVVLPLSAVEQRLDSELDEFLRRVFVTRIAAGTSGRGRWWCRWCWWCRPLWGGERFGTLPRIRCLGE